MSKWHERYKVHPAAECFPPMSDEELAELGEDISKRGLQQPIIFYAPPGIEFNPSNPTDGCVLIDGRNRLEAMERAGIDVVPHTRLVHKGDLPRLIISLNIRRRHLTKQQQADLIIAALRSSRQVGEVTKRHVEGKRGSEPNTEKAEAVAIAGEHGIGKRTVERAFAKAEGRKPAKPKPPNAKDLNLARERYAAEFAKLAVREEEAEYKRLGVAINRARGGR